MIRSILPALVGLVLVASSASAQPGSSPAPVQGDPAAAHEQNQAAQALSDAVRDTISEQTMALINARARYQKCEGDLRSMAARMAAMSRDQKATPSSAEHPAKK